ncbi:MAG: glycerol-3-phosphate dehydrogenase [Legionellales bacterium RIFCSPHIGHO2_12_FULL_35_11]|nr:MAG: glycerol-3-phosphate dehydrogenase [Legionellales bacterium RIFCSPHIGHO2_12_FULL_35_11]
MIGAGSFGTALAIHIAKNGFQTTLWGRDEDHIHEMCATSSNERYLPDIKFPKSMRVSSDLKNTINNADEVILAIPSHAFHHILENIPKPKHGIAWLTKGIDPSTNQPLSQLVINKWGETFPLCVISGPSFAKEVANGMPTTLVVAGNNSDYINKISQIFRSSSLRCYLSHDIIGVQICGAVKNVLAIACGISDGLNFGANAKSALITRGLLEMRRIGTALGAEAETFMGLAGLGDLVLTCTDNQSRNRRFGIQIGQGKSVADAIKNIGQVVEGAQNSEQIYEISCKLKLELPICHAVYDILKRNKTPKDAAYELMNRPMQDEL